MAARLAEEQLEESREALRQVAVGLRSYGVYSYGLRQVAVGLRSYGVYSYGLRQVAVGLRSSTVQGLKGAGLGLSVLGFYGLGFRA